MTLLRWPSLATLGLAALVGCGLGVYDDFAPLSLTDNFRVIEPDRAYRSAQLDAETLELLIDLLGIRTVINLRGSNPDEPWYQNERAVLEANGVELIDVRWSANELPPRDELLKFYDAILVADEPVLMHCKAGADRAGAAAAIWRITVLGDDREAALTELSPATGHFAPFTPAMDELVQMFVPDRDWIVNEYPGP
jgi:protein tyrosine/serine phosphatase